MSESYGGKSVVVINPGMLTRHLQISPLCPPHDAANKVLMAPRVTSTTARPVPLQGCADPGRLSMGLLDLAGGGSERVVRRFLVSILRSIKEPASSVCGGPGGGMGRRAPTDTPDIPLRPGSSIGSADGKVSRLRLLPALSLPVASFG